MTKKQAIQLFEAKKVRTVWDDEQEKWYFCVVDVVEVLTESKAPSGYIKKMKQRDPILSQGWGQIVIPLPFRLATPLSRQPRPATICCQIKLKTRTRNNIEQILS